MSDWISVNDRMPEPGVYVLSYGLNSLGNGRTLRALYAAERTLEQAPDCEGGTYDEETDTIWVDPGWYEANEYEETHWRIEHEVTYWMPLPQPPTPNPEEPETDG